MDVEVGRIRKLSRTQYIAIPEKIMKALRWNHGDCLVLRCVDSTLVLQRVPVEQLARLRAQEAERTPTPISE